jgi:4-amino-4-deoxy-L-arabinose transferase-like glycosyltransferase
MNAFGARKLRLGTVEGRRRPSEADQRAPLLRPSVLAVVFLAVGTLLRLMDFARHSSLWYDEAMLGLNIVQRGYQDLMRPLNFEQVAPVGFLWIQRFVEQLFGPGEYTWRLFPVLASIAALPLLWLAARRLTADWPACAATALVSLSPACLWHAAEAKQYGTEVFVTAALLAIGAVCTGRWNTRRLALLAWAGFAAILLSNAAPFVLAGVGGFLTIDAWRRRASQRRAWMVLLAIDAVWAMLFTVIYSHILVRSHGTESYLQRFWAPAQLTSQPGVWGPCSVVLDSLVYALVGHAAPGLTGWCPPSLFIVVTVLILAGAVLSAVRLRSAAFLLVPWLLPVLPALAGRWIFADRMMLYSVPCTAILIGLSLDWLARRPRIAALFLVPWLLPLLPAFATKRPFADRVLVYSAPCAAIIGGLAMDSLRRRIGARAEWKWAAFGCLLAVVLFPIKTDFQELHEDKQNLREAIQFAIAQHRPGDVVYVYSRSLPPWLFYSTDWGAPDQARVLWLMAAEKTIGPNGGNLPARGHAVENEGFALRRSDGRGTEVIGIADGIFTDSNGRANAGPDPGWVENEFQRVHREMRNGRVVVIGCNVSIPVQQAGAHGLSDLLARFQEAGARRVEQYTGVLAEVDVFQMP